MQNLYRSAGYTFVPRSCQVVSADGFEQTVRPKTFQLLLLLIEAQGEIQSKESILNTIWSDVSVDEQVIFQSIKELRKIFAGSEVIKNYPRQGYAWVPVVERVNATALHDNDDTEPSRHHQRFGWRWISVVVSANAFVFVGLLYLFSGFESVNGSVVVLPVQSNISDSDHNWVRYGGMDQMIQRLSSSEQHGVLQTDYVLEVMSRANITVGDISQAQISQLFRVSGAALVIQLNLSGTVQDYQLIYSLHEKNQMIRGAVLDNSVAGAIDQVADIVAKRLGQDKMVGERHYRSAFANEMLANALESIQNNEVDAAASLLQAAISTEPTNIEAKRVFIRILVESQKSEQAQLLLTKAMRQAVEMESQREIVRLLFWQGALFAQQGQLDLALETLSQAQLAANEVKDWLMLAYVAEVKGRVYQFKQEYTEAGRQYTEAMKYHEVLQCPYGRSNVLLLQSELLFKQDRLEGALDYASRAVSLIEQRQLQDLRADAKAWLDTVNAKQRERN